MPPTLYALVLLAHLTYTGMITFTMIGIKNPQPNMEKCAVALSTLKGYLERSGRAGNIIKAECWTKEKWIEFMGFDPWADKPIGEKI